MQIQLFQRPTENSLDDIWVANLTHAAFEPRSLPDPKGTNRVPAGALVTLDSDETLSEKLHQHVEYLVKFSDGKFFTFCPSFTVMPPSEFGKKTHIRAA